MAIIREVGLGYDAEETHTERRQVLNKAGDVVTLTTSRTVTRHVRDWRAEAWWLEKGRRESWGREPATVQVTGVDGGPVVVESIEAKRARATDLVKDQLAERRRQREESAARSALLAPVYGPPVPEELLG